jgi:hypothetical protein
MEYLQHGLSKEEMGKPISFIGSKQTGLNDKKFRTCLKQLPTSKHTIPKIYLHPQPWQLGVSESCRVDQLRK